MRDRCAQAPRSAPPLPGLLPPNLAACRTPSSAPKSLAHPTPKTSAFTTNPPASTADRRSLASKLSQRACTTRGQPRAISVPIPECRRLTRSALLAAARHPKSSARVSNRLRVRSGTRRTTAHDSADSTSSAVDSEASAGRAAAVMSTIGACYGETPPPPPCRTPATSRSKIAPRARGRHVIGMCWYARRVTRLRAARWLCPPTRRLLDLRPRAHAPVHTDHLLHGDARIT